MFCLFLRKCQKSYSEISYSSLGCYLPDRIEDSSSGGIHLLCDQHPCKVEEPDGDDGANKTDQESGIIAQLGDCLMEVSNPDTIDHDLVGNHGTQCDGQDCQAEQALPANSQERVDIVLHQDLLLVHALECHHNLQQHRCSFKLNLARR